MLDVPLAGTSLFSHAFSDVYVSALVRPVGRRRLRQFAGRIGGSNVAFRGITPDPTTAIQAVVGSGVEAGRMGIARSNIISPFEGLPVRGRAVRRTV